MSFTSWLICGYYSVDQGYTDFPGMSSPSAGKVSKSQAALEHMQAASLTWCVVGLYVTRSSVNLSSIDELISPLVSRGSVSNIQRERLVYGGGRDGAGEGCHSQLY